MFFCIRYSLPPTLANVLCQTDKSLSRPGRKQARKHVREGHDFNNIETRAFIKFSFPARQGAEGNSRHSERNISLFHSWSSYELISTPVQLVQMYLKYASYYFTTCAVNLLLFCTMTNKCTTISQMITLLHVSTLLCHLREIVVSTLPIYTSILVHFIINRTIFTC